MRLPVAGRRLPRTSRPSAYSLLLWRFFVCARLRAQLRMHVEDKTQIGPDDDGELDIMEIKSINI